MVLVIQEWNPERNWCSFHCVFLARPCMIMNAFRHAASAGSGEKQKGSDFSLSFAGLLCWEAENVCGHGHILIGETFDVCTICVWEGSSLEKDCDHATALSVYRMCCILYRVLCWCCFLAYRVVSMLDALYILSSNHLFPFSSLFSP